MASDSDAPPPPLPTSSGNTRMSQESASADCDVDRVAGQIVFMQGVTIAVVQRPWVAVRLPVDGEAYRPALH